MLLRVLKVIYEKGTFSSTVISQETGISLELVKEFKGKLETMKFIEKEENCEKTTCKGCACGCSSKNLSDMINWKITNKGMKLLEKNK